MTRGGASPVSAGSVCRVEGARERDPWKASCRFSSYLRSMAAPSAADLGGLPGTRTWAGDMVAVVLDRRLNERVVAQGSPSTSSPRGPSLFSLFFFFLLFRFRREWLWPPDQFFLAHHHPPTHTTQGGIHLHPSASQG